MGGLILGASFSEFRESLATKILVGVVILLSFGIFDSNPVLPLDLHVAHNVWTPLLTSFNFLKLRMEIEALLNHLLCRDGHARLHELLNCGCDCYVSLT